MNASYLYVDSHVKLYNGTRLVPEVPGHRYIPPWSYDPRVPSESPGCMAPRRRG